MPSPQTWKRTVPKGATSSSIPTFAVKVEHVPPTLYFTSDGPCAPKPFANVVPRIDNVCPSPAACSPLLSSFSTGPQPLVIDVQVRLLRYVGPLAPVDTVVNV